MKKNNNFLNIITRSVTLVICISLTLIFTVICITTCYISSNKNRQLLNDEIDSYAESIRASLDDGIRRSEYLKGNMSVLNAMNTKYTSFSANLTASNNIKYIMASLRQGGNDKMYITIFTPKKDLFKNEYIIDSEQLADFNELSEQLRHGNIVWSDSLLTDSIGDYIVFYRPLSDTNDSIMECRIYVPPYSGSDSLCLVPVSSDKGTYEIKKDINNNYSLLYTPDKNKIYKNISSIVTAFFFSLLAFILVITLVTYKIANKITGELSRFALQLDTGNTTVDNMVIESDPDDIYELAIIKDTVNMLINNISNLKNSQYENILLQKNLELTVLRNQIDPHTLYNSFSAIKLNAERKNDNFTVFLMRKMTEYYRLILGRGIEYVTLSEELEMINKYIEINELSHGKKYNPSYYVTEDLKSTHVLHMILQPFVENSIVHGLAGNRRHCEIDISAHYENGFAVIIIEDNGYGIPSDILTRLNNLDTFYGGHGIKNSYTRLKLAYGNDSTIKFESTPNEGTRVIICFRPLK